MIKTNEWVCGNVAVKATLTLPDETPAGVATLSIEGLTQILQRKPSSAWEKAEAGTLGMDTKSKNWREGFKRNSIPYSAASAQRLIDGFVTALPDDVDVEFTVSEHVGGAENLPTKEASELWDKVVALTGEARNTALEKLELDGVTDDAAGIAACKKLLQDSKRAAAAAAKAAVGI